MKGIVIGKTNYDCLFTLIDMVKDKPGRHIFVVPDRMSVVCEKAIFERLNIESTCNIEVMTLSRIASRVLKNIQVITKTASVMILQKILNQNKQNLKCFNKTITSDLASNIFGTISQFKSCKVGFNDVSVKVDKSLLGDKIDDISLLYRCYQEELSKRGLMDSLDKLNFLEQEIKNSSYIRGASFYVAFFDGFTYQGYDIISAISNFAQNFYVGVTYSYGLNEHIYNKNYLDTMSKILKNAIVIQSSGVAYSKQFEFALDNLFTFAPAQLKIDSSNIDFYVGDNFEEELELSCMKIRQGIIKNECKTCDFNIAVPNLSDRKDIVANVFKKYDINYYLDLQNDFKDSAMMVYLGFAFDIVTENFSKNSILNFVKHNFFDMDVNALCDFEDYIIRYNITDKYDLQNTKVETSPLYENFCMVKGVLFDKIKDFYQSVEKSKTYGDFVENTKKLIEKLHLSEIIDKKISEFIIDNNLEQARIYEQFMDSLNEILDTLRKILGDEECVFKDYISVLQGVEKSISTSPLSIDAVFIGDPSVSFFEKRKVLYIVGMSESDYPRQVQDCGLISDEDIRDLSIKYKLEPSIYEINRKERFRAYELLFVPTQKLVLSYNYKQEKSKIYEDLRNLFVLSKDDKIEELDIKTIKDVEFLVKNNYLSCARLNFCRDYREILDGQKTATKDIDLLYSALGVDDEKLKVFDFENKLDLKSSLFFAKGKTSISEIETFMTCPFLHFARYGLRLKEKVDGEMDRLSIGNILHLIAKKLLSENKLPVDNIEDKAREIFDDIIKTDLFADLKYNKQNKILLKNLKEESIRFARALNIQATYSKFVPKFFEIRFDDNSKIKSIKIKTKKGFISLVGQIDRVDFYDSFFRVIDYKTGKTDNSLKELFFGKKVQLEAYIKVVGQSYKNLKCAGAYYLPIKEKFYDASKDESKYALTGRTLEDDNVVNASDTRFDSLTNSDIIDVKLKSNIDGQKSYSAYSHTVSQNDLDNISNYAINLITRAVNDILQNNITPSPLVLASSNPCENCSFYGLCRFDEGFKNIARVPKKSVKISDFAKE